MVQPGCLEHIKSDTIRVEKWPSAEAAWDTINHAGALSQPGHYQIHLHTPPPHLMHRLEWTGKWTFSHAALPRYLVPRKDTVLLFHFRPGEAKELWGMQMKESKLQLRKNNAGLLLWLLGMGWWNTRCLPKYGLPCCGCNTRLSCTCDEFCKTEHFSIWICQKEVTQHSILFRRVFLVHAHSFCHRLMHRASDQPTIPLCLKNCNVAAEE